MNKEQREYLSQLVSFACSDYETEVDKILDNCEALNHLFHMDEYYMIKEVLGYRKKKFRKN